MSVEGCINSVYGSELSAPIANYFNNFTLFTAPSGAQGGFRNIDGTHAFSAQHCSGGIPTEHTLLIFLLPFLNMLLDMVMDVAIIY